ncbi:hypothetical protein [Actinomadura rupiterrae]|uniref:hypothetical protein n=1 Tax=Actinomadura rupiterrae TaxID=559627 RepID=UPI0020A26982|nr:hypothetical protein [Actinomadura rupiterrae]MCP2338268.1 hypothetical protein [Actinomadura rupiterrae]
MRGRSLRAVRTFAVTTVVVAVLGPLAGVLWHALAPTVGFVVLRGEPFISDGEGQGPIGTDARFALIGIVAGLLCGVVAYRFGGRDNDIPLIAGLAAGGTAAALLAWWVGHQFGLSHYQHVVRTGTDGTEVNGPADLRARGVLVFWPLLAVGAYAVLEMIVKRLPAADTGDHPADGGGGQAVEDGGHPGGDGGQAIGDGRHPGGGGQAIEDGGRPGGGEGGLAARDGEGGLAARDSDDGLAARDGDGGLAARDGGEPGAGKTDKVGGGELDLESAPPGRDVDGRKS